ncbi:dihydrolipoyl dehydrogenase [Capillibacterium thermochitinicola]|uniref:Dihydrolipoyl dehydrogenase n=1 Tax=Capillibacterium thermochitinicola TaxID=2699427 RepID=A0A8J6I079_9FIRM|nr:dihydrolipoyl dehydrogenase [Capillibacterium thermochitinicola]MBA2133061.1 dihydrolipoyl dehydrogenase [Capillibacterium thermochitinicola]
MVYDLIVLGGGPAGYHGAALAGRKGLRTLLIEERALGGVCLHNGCIPSKTWLQSAKLFAHVQNGAVYGVKADGLHFDQQVVTARKNKVVRILSAGVKTKLQNANVEVVTAKGEIQGKDEDGFRIKAGADNYKGKNLLLATGSVPVIPPIPGLKEGLAAGTVKTNAEIFDLNHLPASLVVIGGGVIGLEMAAYFSAAGSKVTVIELLDRIGGEIDREIAGILYDNYRKKGVDFKLNTRVTAVDGSRVQFTSPTGDGAVEAELVLLSAGRRPLLSGFGLETLQPHMEQGRLVVDRAGRTSVPGLYAAGDVNGRSMLAHTAYREAEVCIDRILGGTEEVNYEAIPAVIYTDPEVASVGETAESAARKGLAVQTVKVSMRYSGRYVAEHEGGDGICKLVVNRGDRRLLGVHLIAEYASELIYGAGLMIDRELRIDEIEKIVFPHPTVSEIIKEAALQYGSI